MGGLFDRLMSRHLIMYDPTQWSKRLGEKCDRCEKSLTHEKCVSLCNCYFFAHEDCFKAQFSGQIFDKDTEIRCSKCQYELRMNICQNYMYSVAVTKWKVFKLTAVLVLLALMVVGILLTLGSEIKVEVAFFILYAEGVGLCIVLYALLHTLRDIFYRKTIKIQQVLSTKLDIQTSAFKDIEMETNEEITKDSLFADKR